VVRDDASLSVFTVRPRGAADAIEDALRREDRERAECSWAGAASGRATPARSGSSRIGNRLVDSRTIRVAAPPPVAFQPILRLGGATGWYYGDWLWQLRGWLDLLAGGAGLRRGRRDPERLVPGDALDCWRVEACDARGRLRLVSEMKLPGRAWLEFEVTPDGTGSLIRQTAVFDPVGLAGLVYWYSVYVLHNLLFEGMLSGIARASRA